ncbi:MAG: hypothetical protein WBA28_04895 [Microbacteriaceae bacterium]
MKIHRGYKTPTSNPNVGGKNFWKGWCHAQTRGGFNIPAVPGYGSAEEARRKAKRFHANRNFPNAAVPIFFSLKNVPAGHSAVRLANGEIETTGLNDTVLRFASLDALLQRWPALNYLGWSEDINGYDIISGYNPAPAPVPEGRTVAQLADEVIRGLHGNGDARKKSLGSQYSAVQAEVNRRLAGGGKTIAQLATEVIQGKHGNGAARKKSLGSQYAAVQAEVNKRLK